MSRINEKVNVAVLVSGGGTNLQALIDAQAAGLLPRAHFCCVASSKPGVYALERAAAAGIPGVTVARADYGSSDDYSAALDRELERRGAEIIVLAGFLSILSPAFCKKYANRILNVHPSLIPAFCGDGFYGLRVHKAVLDYGVKVTGATVHFVNEVTDGGKILLQKAVDVLPGDTPELLQKRVMEQAEWELLPRALALVTGEYDQNRRDNHAV